MHQRAWCRAPARSTRRRGWCRRRSRIRASTALHAADAAVALVQQREVVGVAVGERRAAGGVGAGAVGERREVQLGAAPAPPPSAAASGQRRQSLSVSSVSSLGCSVAAAQCGNGQSRSFSLPSRQSWARPCGSTIRKSMISSPISMISTCAARSVGQPRPADHDVLQEDRHQHHEGRRRRSEPKIEPRPPMMTMKSTRNETRMPKASVTSTAPK